jgi:hypothetical protein
MASGQVKGMTYPTQQAMLGANPRDSAIAQQNADTQKLMELNAVGGKKNKKGGADGIVVPQFQMAYKPTGGPGQDPNSIITQNSQLSVQGAANSEYDKYATTGGKKRKSIKKRKTITSRSKRGGDAKWYWGCSSGGKRKSNKRKSNKRKSSKRK